MPLEKKFDVDDVVEKAMHAFWHKGYEATSMRDLVKSMGINPGSIYATFGDKKNLFKLALEHYERQNQAMLSEFEQRYTPRRAILAIFEQMVTDAKSTPDNPGCFLVNSVLERSPGNEEIGQVVEKGLDNFEATVRRIIRKGQEIGEIGDDLDPDRTARLLHTLIAGTRVLSKGRSKHVILREIADHVENILT